MSANKSQTTKNTMRWKKRGVEKILLSPPLPEYANPQTPLLPEPLAPSPLTLNALPWAVA